MEYKPKNAKNKKPYVLVGKGVVYDTGGLSLKPTPASMDLMNIRQAVVDEMRKVELRADAVTGAAEDAARSLTINPTMVELAINAATAFQSITNANRTR